MRTHLCKENKLEESVIGYKSKNGDEGYKSI